jgi:hypothetical protein
MRGRQSSRLGQCSGMTPEICSRAVGLREVLWMIRHPLSSPPPTEEELSAELAEDGEGDPSGGAEPKRDLDLPASSLPEQEEGLP